MICPNYALNLKNPVLKKTDWIFFFDTVAMSKYSNVSFVIKLLLTLCHGQASVERQQHAVYKAKLEEERKEVALSEHEKQAAHISNDVKKMKQQVNQMNKSILLTS